ncbi:tyrosine--tRNA ligase [Saccharomycopsis crataegensis]|uniref:Tyrosine--tRNA ligase n=1 Tax=Saccharomycopsis crataegensis TaxID=43959 RepID=A0AAV5QQ94_9ASCO|nr:tyrosine--tRNA ligase [Saccharomycopsis crataegensis]
MLTLSRNLRFGRRDLFYISRRFNSSFQIDATQLELESKEELIPHLQKRGLIDSISSDDLRKFAQKTQLSLYCGADPTAKSLHLGNLLPLLILVHFNIRGHSVVGLVGGATGKVGDPSGRSSERTAMDSETRLDNTSRIKFQLADFLNSSKDYVKSLGFPVPDSSKTEVADNFDWWKGVGLLEFLANYGKYIRVNSMLGRESIKARLSSDAGIGFNEFTYQILQAYDFWHLYKNNNVTVQVGGNDQWGNITAGIDFISRMKSFHSKDLKSLSKEEQEKQNEFKKLLEKPVFGLTVPLLTTASGQKFGKSMGNAVFIDKNVTPSFEMYNYFMKSQDSELEKLLKIFTFIPLKQIDQILEEHSKDPSLRVGQRILADQITRLIHGELETYNASIIASILFPTPEQPYPTDIKTDQILKIFEDANLLKKISKSDIIDKKFSEVLSKASGSSRTEARNTVKSGGLYFGYDRARADPTDSVLLTEDLLIDGKLLLLRVGKAKYHIVEIL